MAVCWIVYVLGQSAVLDPSLVPGSQDYEFLEVDKKNIVTDVDPEPKRLQDSSKDQGDELIEVSLREEGREAQPFFINISLFTNLKPTFLDLLKNQRFFLTWTYADRT